MSEASKIQIPRVKLGNQGLEVSKMGFGCMGLTGVYNSPVSDEDGISIIVAAFNKGITFFDTADVYGPHTNELLVGKALKQLPREKIQLATKFGVVFGGVDPPGVTAKGTPEYVRSCCEASLKRLDVDYIDLYYQHRVDTSVPIEETMGELKKLVEEGKVKYIGLSEASPDTIRRAHAVHPVTALQMEWSLWTREIEEEVVPLCRELGIGIVPYSPLGRGFFGGKAVVESLPSNSALLSTHPRFIGENLEKNKNIYNRMESLAKKHQCLTAQLALAWVLHQGDDVVPIPGTTKIKNLDVNIGSLKVKLGEEDLKEVSGAVPLDQVAGERTYVTLRHLQWKFANTPPKKLLNHQ
ncbi:PREDICTED: probable aldo-keto reductase 1-like [Fragaria vesca subsp. vesca]